jgi:hypothetical protein
VGGRGHPPSSQPVKVYKVPGGPGSMKGCTDVKHTGNFFSPCGVREQMLRVDAKPIVQYRIMKVGRVRNKINIVALLLLVHVLIAAT